MKILILSNLYPVHARPFQHSFVREEARLVSRFSEVHVADCLPFKPAMLFRREEYTNYIKDDFPVEPMVYLSVPRRRLSGITAGALGKKTGRILDKVKPDVMHAHFLYPCGLAVQEAKKRNIPTVITIHGVDWYHSIIIPSLKRRIDRIIESTDRIICVGPRLENDVKKVYPEASEKIRTLLHGIDFNFFRPKETNKIANGRINILCVARFVHKKGLHLLIDAISNSEKLKTECSFTIIGDKTDRKYYDRILRQITDESIGNITIQAPVGRDDLLAFYQQADFYVQPSLDEPFGLSLLEAIACGLPAVALSSGGPDVIINEQNGILMKNQEGLKSALERMCADWKNYPEMQLHDSVKSRFDSSIKQEKLEDIYKTIQKKS